MALLRAENVVRNPALEAGVEALSLMGGACDLAHFPLMIGPGQLTELLIAAVGTAALPSNELTQDMEADVSSFLHVWPTAFPVIPAQDTIILRADHWAAWMIAAQSGDHLLQNNRSGNCPDGVAPRPAANELHPWVLAGYLDHDVTANAPLPRIGDIPAILELVILLAVLCAGGATIS